MKGTRISLLSSLKLSSNWTLEMSLAGLLTQPFALCRWRVKSGRKTWQAEKEI